MTGLANNKEVIAMNLAIDTVKPYFALCGLADPEKDLQAFNINYSVDVGSELDKIEKKVVDAREDLTKNVRNKVLHDWDGQASETFETYVNDVLHACDEMQDRIAGQKAAIEEVLAEVKKIVQDVHKQVMSSAQTVGLLLTPLTQSGAAVIGQRIAMGDQVDPISLVIDPLSLLVGVVNDGVIRIMNLRNTLAGSEADLGALADLKTPDGKSVADMDLQSESDWSIDADDPNVHTGLEKDTIDDPDQWVQADNG